MDKCLARHLQSTSQNTKETLRFQKKTLFLAYGHSYNIICWTNHHVQAADMKHYKPEYSPAHSLMTSAVFQVFHSSVNISVGIQ